MMHRSVTNFPITVCRLQGRRGFSFVEVMFAVIVLGIGFIMVSAMFPVAIQQTQSNVEDSAVGRVVEMAQTNFAQLGPDLRAQISSNGAAVPLSYAWPMTLAPLTTPPAGQTVYPGKIFSFRDARWLAMTGPPPGSPPQSPPPGTPPQFPVAPTGSPLGSKFQFPLYSNLTGLSKVNGLWDRVRGNMISPAEPQYAYVPMFQRGLSYNPNATPPTWTPSSQVNLYVFIAAARNRTPYSYTNFNSGPHSDVFRNGFDTTADNDTYSDSGFPPANSPPATLEPRLVTVAIIPRSGAQITDQIVIQASNFGQPDAWLAAGTGGYVIISDDTNGVTTPPWPAWGPGLYNGHVYRLGAQTTLTPPLTAPTNSSTWELQPGLDVSNPATFPSGIAMQAFILGRAYRNPDAPYDKTNNPYDGPVQDMVVQPLSPITISP
jgi:type II secretory pathway pseudopilin PulG